MDKFDKGINRDGVTEEEMREMARRYAQELLLQGVEPSEQELVADEAKHLPHVPATVSEAPLIDNFDDFADGLAKKPEAVAPAPVSEPEKHAKHAAAPEAPRASRSASDKVEKPAKKGRFGRGKKESKEMQALAKRVADNSDRYGLSNPEIEADGPSIDLTKLKKNDLLEIMLRQAEEMDALRAENADLRAQLESREIKIMKSGSIAEAALKLTKVFEEAQKAADLYLANIRNETGEEKTLYQYYRGADSDE